MIIPPLIEVGRTKYRGKSSKKLKAPVVDFWNGTKKVVCGYKSKIEISFDQEFQSICVIIRGTPKANESNDKNPALILHAMNESTASGPRIFRTLLTREGKSWTAKCSIATSSVASLPFLNNLLIVQTQFIQEATSKPVYSVHGISNDSSDSSDYDDAEYIWDFHEGKSQSLVRGARI